MIRDTLIRDDANKQISFDDRSMQFGRSVATSRHDFTTAFELAPDAQRLFPSDMERQHLKLMDMIAAIVGALDERELFQSIIGDTGRQHARFGVNPSHFVAFGDALIWSLEHQFGPAFTPELREAWIALYNAVRSEMIRAAQDAAFERGATLFLRHPSFLAAPLSCKLGQNARLMPAKYARLSWGR